MTMRMIVLASTACLLLGTAANASPPRHPNAAEAEQTRQLNLQASQPTLPAGTTAGSDISAPKTDIAMAPIALNSLSSPPDKIATAKVVDDHGTVVGAVQKVDLDQTGKPSRVEIALLGSDRIVALDSAHLSYDSSNNIVTTAIDKTQIVQLPPAG